MDYYIIIDGQRIGPLEETELRARVASGDADGQTPVWHEGLEKWKPCAEVLTGVPQPELWFAMVGQQRLGPLHRGALERAVALGQVTAETKVWKAGMPKWRSWGKVAAEEGVKVSVLDGAELDGGLHPASPGGASFEFQAPAGRRERAKDGAATSGRGVFSTLFGRLLPGRREN